MRCTIETRDFGTMVFTLYPEYAPHRGKLCENCTQRFL